MQNQKETRFFIGSNSGRGFFSYFDFFYEPSEMKKVSKAVPETANRH